MSAQVTETSAEPVKLMRPSNFFQSATGKVVTVKLNTGAQYRGRITSLDGFMNIAMEDVQLVSHGATKKHYKEAFLRGNNVLYINLADRDAK